MESMIQENFHQIPENLKNFEDKCRSLLKYKLFHFPSSTRVPRCYNLKQFKCWPLTTCSSLFRSINNILSSPRREAKLLKILQSKHGILSGCSCSTCSSGCSSSWSSTFCWSCSSCSSGPYHRPLLNLSWHSPNRHSIIKSKHFYRFVVKQIIGMFQFAPDPERNKNFIEETSRRWLKT